MRKWKPPTIPTKCDAIKRVLKELHESKRRAASGRNNKEYGNTQQTELKTKDLDYLLEEPTKCPYCPKEYETKQSLGGHINANHWKQQRVAKVC